MSALESAWQETAQDARAERAPEDEQRELPREAQTLSQESAPTPRRSTDGRAVSSSAMSAGPFSPLLDPTPLACPVRDCGLELALTGRALRCERGHAFDLSRRGALNLLQPQDRRSLAAGDSPEAIEARARTLARGLCAPLVDELLALLERAPIERSLRVLDLGCGTGWFLAALAERASIRGTGLDLSARAIDRAARDHPGFNWIVANADRRLPLLGASFDLILSITAPRNPAESHRVLSPAGHFAVAVPAPDDLIELRASVLGEGRKIERAEKALAHLGASFELEHRFEVRSRPRLDAGAQRDLLASTYRAGRPSRTARAAALEERDVTLSYELLWLRPRPFAGA